MAKFLSTAAAVSDALQEIVKRAEERLWLISPYLRLNAPIRDLIEAKKNSPRIEIHMVCRENQLLPREKDWLESMSFVKTYICEHLHAKCYLNENEALVTSMNLTADSQVNNYEMGIRVYRAEEPDLYDAISEGSRTIVRSSEVSRETSHESTQPTPKIPYKVFCIRCREVSKPTPPKRRRYCPSCYEDWRQFSEKLPYEEAFNHEEKYCHVCGIEYPATWRYPACNDCFKKYPDFFKASTTESV